VLLAEKRVAPPTWVPGTQVGVVEDSLGLAPYVEVGGVRFEVEIADTPEKRERGLSGRAPLAPNEGMLFVFDEPGIYSFWMKEMLFPIDIVWIDEEGRVVHITENADPSSYPQTFSPPSPVLYVLEISAGLVKINNISLGNQVFLKKEL